jgi:hypothetical protein
LGVRITKGSVLARNARTAVSTLLKLIYELDWKDCELYDKGFGVIPKGNPPDALPRDQRLLDNNLKGTTVHDLVDKNCRISNRRIYGFGCLRVGAITLDAQ